MRIMKPLDTWGPKGRHIHQTTAVTGLSVFKTGYWIDGQLIGTVVRIFPNLVAVFLNSHLTANANIYLFAYLSADTTNSLLNWRLLALKVSDQNLQTASACAYLRFGVILWIAARLQPPSAAGSKTRPLQATLLLLDDWIPGSPSYWLLVRMTRPTTNGVKMFTSGSKWIEKNTPEKTVCWTPSFIVYQPKYVGTSGKDCINLWEPLFYFA